ncbi:WD40/YVTN repeat-like-containing domain superfamily [Sesbania bispinosa]|nr:WD40/YVTN repeat-like-containing domain superfamily [Sesbania bispinosa]
MTLKCSLRLWAVSGEALMEMVGHTAIVYSVDSHASGLIVSGSEDRFAKIWKDGVCVQSIEHPGCVWDVKFMENGDIVTACSDGIVRIWTVHHEYFADQLELDLYTSQLSQYKSSRKRVGGLKLEELPGLEALKIPDKSSQRGGQWVAYAWNMTEQKWDKIGEVVDGPDESNRPIFDGIQYDYVFDVDIGDGMPIRKLPYNRSDNPYDVADKWLLKENLPLSFREQIVQFILQNTGQKDTTFDASFRDPYTGSHAYVPGQPSRMSDISAKPTFKHIPKKGMLVFDTAQFDGILKKIIEFNNALLSDQEKQNLSLSELDVSNLGAIVKTLKDTSHYHSSKFADSDIALLLNLLRSWPIAMIFPVIDIVRMLVLHPDGAIVLRKHFEAENDILMEVIKKVTINPTIPANLLTSIRAVTNLFKNSCFYNWLQKHRSEFIPNKNLQLSYSTLILNYAVLLIESKDQEGQSQVLSAALEVVEDENIEADSKFRALVAVGSLALSPINSSNPCLPKTHFLKVPVFHLFFKFKPFPYNNHGVKRAHTLSFTINCKLKSSQDIKNKGKGVPQKIVLSESSPPPLTEDDDINGGSDSGEVRKYPEDHPVLGFFTWRWVLALGFDHMFTSPIFLGMLALLGASLMACTYTTQLPLIKVARRWSFLHSAESIRKQEFSESLPRASIQDVGTILMGAGYEVFLKGPSLYAFQGLAGRLAPVGVHIALLLIMAGGTLSATGSFRGSVTVPQGLNFVVGDVLGPTGFLSSPSDAFNTEIHVNRFYMDYYDSGEVSQFHTDLSLFNMDGKEVMRKTISDNEGPYNLAMAPLKINGDKKLFGTFLPVGDINSPDVKGMDNNFKIFLEKEKSMLARDLQSIVLYDKEGKFAGVRRPNSKLPINIDGSEIVIVDTIGSSGLDLKTDPGVPVVYAGFGALMLTTCISYLSHSQIWALQDGTRVVIGGKTNRAKIEFQDEMNRLLDKVPEIVESPASKQADSFISG